MKTDHTELAELGPEAYVDFLLSFRAFGAVPVAEAAGPEVCEDCPGNLGDFSVARRCSDSVFRFLWLLELFPSFMQIFLVLEDLACS
jgi:hypothetical protein